MRETGETYTYYISVYFNIYTKHVENFSKKKSILVESPKTEIIDGARARRKYKKKNFYLRLIFRRRFICAN
jgi:hypothetical protein